VELRLAIAVRMRSSNWILAALAVGAGVALLIVLDLIEDPDSSLSDVFLNLFEELPIVLVTVAAVLLYQLARRRREENRGIVEDLAVARLQGQQWREQAQAHLAGLGVAIDAQFVAWQLSAAEREVALLLLKGLSTKEIATVRATSERTAREQARAVYAKAGLAGRAALSAYFLEDLLAPVEGTLPRAATRSEAVPRG
jgi:DNA-binding CsgD family transcriptional regulator